nr:hypothetical protein [Microbacterium bovistercoris]
MPAQPAAFPGRSDTTQSPNTFRDRTIDLDADVGFDLELATVVEDFEHESGAGAMDYLVARTTELRDLIQRRQEANNRAGARVRLGK